MRATVGIRAHVALKQSGGLFYGAGSVKKKRLSAFLAYPGAKHGRVQAVAVKCLPGCFMLIYAHERSLRPHRLRI